MTYSVTNRMGGSDPELPESAWMSTLNELDEHDPEHPDCWLSHDSGWTLSYHYRGILILINGENDEEKHIDCTDKEKVLKLWKFLSLGNIEVIKQEKWIHGNGIPAQTKEERLEVERKILNWLREWYDSLGPENPKEKCRTDNCNRGVVKYSVMCRRHHFEMIRNIPCPFF